MSAEVITADGRISYAELAGRALSVAAELRECGMRAGHRVLLRPGYSAEDLADLLALMHLNVSIVLMEGQRGANELARLARRSRARAVPAAGAGPALAAAGPVPTTLPRRPGHGETTAVDPRELRLADWLSRPDALITLNPGAQRSGPVVRSGPALLRTVRAARQRLGYRPEDVLLPLPPYSHGYGVHLTLLCWTSGCSLVLAPASRPDRALLLAGTAQVTAVDAAPATYANLRRLLAHRPALRSGLRRVRSWSAHGAPLPGDPLAASLTTRQSPEELRPVFPRAGGFR